MLVRTRNAIQNSAERLWRWSSYRVLSGWDRVRDFFVELEEETRPAHRRPRRNRREPSVPSVPERVRKAAVPEDTRVYAIGDIHGRADLLKQLMVKIEADAEAAPERRKVIVFLGDYVDRGFQSKDVIDFLLSDALGAYETRFLKGNHESALEMFLNDPDFGPEWARFGGAETIMSYGVQPPRARTSPDKWREACERLNTLMPKAHRHFLSELELYCELGDYLFVHAGLRPGRPLEQQAERDLLWIRDDFLNDPGLFDRMIVHGHTPIQAPHRDGRRIGVDTGAYLTGRLTAACLSGTNVSFIAT